MHTENQNTEPFEQTLRERLSAFQEEPTSAAWSEIQKKLAPADAGQSSYRFGKGFFYQTATAVIIAAVAVYFFYSSEKIQSHSNLKNPKRSAPALKSLPTTPSTQSTQGTQELKLKNNDAIGSKSTSSNVPQGKVIAAPNRTAANKIAAPNTISTSLPSLPGATRQEIIFVENLQDSTLAIEQPGAIDSIRVKPNAKTFYEKQRSDTTVRYRQLFINKKPQE